MNGYKGVRHKAPDLQDAFIRPDGRPITSKYVGQQLASDAGRWSNGQSIQLAKKDFSKNTNTYQIVGQPTDGTAPGQEHLSPDEKEM
jgi:hypothetical protein